jgi:hypothetical protein
MRRAAATVLALTVACAGCGTGVRHTLEPNPSTLDNWNAVMRLNPRDLITVVDAAGTSTSGLLVSVEKNQLTIKTLDGNRDWMVARSDIRRVLLSHLHWSSSSTLSGFAKGSLGGAALGAFIGLLVGGSPAVGAAVLGTLGALCGSVVGVVSDLFLEKDEPDSDIVLVYYSTARP